MGGQGTRPLDDIAGYYAGKLAEHGQTARGVDWNGEEGQVRRFEQLCRLIAGPGPFSVNDLGCGYGALYDHLAGRYAGFTYLGVDVSPDMVAAARQRHAHRPAARFMVGTLPDQPADFGMASGIFNVRLGRPDGDWQQHVLATLDGLDRTSRRGFAFNCLTSYADPDRQRDYLYYADPCRLFDHCKRHYSPQVALLHDYGIYEFTILVRKP